MIIDSKYNVPPNKLYWYSKEGDLGGPWRNDFQFEDASTGIDIGNLIHQHYTENGELKTTAQENWKAKGLTKEILEAVEEELIKTKENNKRIVLINADISQSTIERVQEIASLY